MTAVDRNSGPMPNGARVATGPVANREAVSSQALKRLAAKADVLIENYKVGDLARRGLDYATLSALNPRLVYCSITGFGQTGPDAQRGALDPIVQAMAGVMSLTGERE